MIKNPPFTRVFSAALLNIRSRHVSREFAGSTSERSGITIIPENVSAFAKATLDPFYDNDHTTIPVLYPARLFHPLYLDLMTRKGIGVNLIRVVHGETRFTFHHALALNDSVDVRVTLSAVESTPAGDMLIFDGVLMRGGVIICERRDGFLVRSGKSSGNKKSAPHESKSVCGISTLKGMSRRYAHASLDTNPIHTHSIIARAAGFRGVICHGLCTLALTGNAVIQKYAGGRPERLRTLSARFSGPVYPGESLTLEELAYADGSISFEIKNRQGKTVLSKGFAEVSE